MIKYVLMFLSLFFMGCKTYQASELPDKQLIWGSGGGFTGVVNQYILLDNGQLFFADGLKNTTLACTKQSKQDAKAFFTKCDSLGIADMKMNEPGNLYYFIKYKTTDAENTLTWGAMDAEVDEEVKALYDELQGIAQTSEIIEKNKTETAVQ